jgi:hypothetical protein
MAAGFGAENARRPGLAVDAIGIDNARIDGRALDHRPAGARLPTGNVTVEVRPRCARGIGIHDHVVRIDAVAIAQQWRNARAALGLLPPVEHLRSSVSPAHRQRAGIEQSRAAQVQHHFRHAAGHEHLHGGKRDCAARSAAHRPAAALPVDARPVVGRRPAQSRGMRDRRNVQDQVGGSAERRVRHHGVVQSGVGESRIVNAARFERQHGASRTARHIEPDRLTGRRQRRMRQRHAQRFADHLRRRGRAQELAAAAGRRAGAAEVGGGFEGDLPMREARADDCTRPASSPSRPAA